MGSHFLLLGILPTQESNLNLLSLLHCSQILYHLSHWESTFCTLEMPPQMPPIATILPEKWPRKELNSLMDGTSPTKHQSQSPHESIPFHIHPVAGGPRTDHSPFPLQEARVLPQGVSIKLLLLPGIEPGSPASQTDYSLSESPGKPPYSSHRGVEWIETGQRGEILHPLSSPHDSQSYSPEKPETVWNSAWIVLLTSTLAVWQ